MNFEDLEMEFMNGSCASLAQMFNQKYGYRIFHVFEYLKTDDEEDDYIDDDNGVIHTLVQKCPNKYLDITGEHSAKQIIDQWYYNRGTIYQFTEIFLIDDSMEYKIHLSNGVLSQTQITDKDHSRYKFKDYMQKINYDYLGKFNISEVCEYTLNNL